MRTALVTGAAGLVGSECVRHFVKEGYHVVGIDNDMRRYFFGDAASTKPAYDRLEKEVRENATLYRDVDIRDYDRLGSIFQHRKPELILHCAAQPAHDWAAKEPLADFSINATGTVNMLEATRKHCPDATFVHCSTSKVYGDTPNRLPLTKVRNRLDLAPNHPYYYGIDTTMSIDQCLHSLFGASKASGDLMVQEYGRYFDMPTVCFRPGCLTGPAHAGTELHGFLSYLVRCAITGKTYNVYGYDGLQVRCNVHSEDLVRAFHEFHRHPTAGAVFNIGGGRENSCSMWEAIGIVESVTGTNLNWEYMDEARIGDHRWWISDNRPFQRIYDWHIQKSLTATVFEIYNQNVERWSLDPVTAV